MSSAAQPSYLIPFLTQALERDGAAVEEVGSESIFVVLPEALRGPLDLPAATTLDLSSAPADGQQAFPLEGAGMQWCVDRARGRGRRAFARLASPPQNPSGRLAKARARLVLPNATIVHSEATRPLATRLLLEFGYDAQCEERTDGRVQLAVPLAGGAPSAALAEVLTASLSLATPERPTLDEVSILATAERVAPRVEAEVRRQLDPFRRDSIRRLEAEQERIVAYHERLAREGNQRRRGADADAVASKRAAIRRQQVERLDDLAERHAVAATYWLASVLVLRYEVGRCCFRLRRRRREIDVHVEWDPFLGDFLGAPCAACGTHGFFLHVCDAAGHVTCASCAARCDACARVTCRACLGDGCGCDTG